MSRIAHPAAPPRLTHPGVPSPSAAGTAAQAASPAIRRVAQEFESLMLGQMLRGMTEGLGEGGSIGNAEDNPWASLLQDEYAKLLSRRGGLGVADAVVRELLKAQEPP
jgi:Rod binding domain-containing protein